MNTKHPALVGVIPAIVALLAYIASLLGVDFDAENATALLTQLIGAASGVLSIGLMLWAAYKNRPVNVDQTKTPKPGETTAGTAPVK